VWPTSTVRKPVTFTFPDGWKSKGEIDYPTGDGPFPTVVLLHGSGPNDMDQTIPGEPGDSKVFLQIAAHLSTKGFAVVRYNKRGVLDIGPDLEPGSKRYTLTNYIDDAKSVLASVKTFDRVDPQRIVFLGHSEGTLTGSVIARSDVADDVAGLALLGVVGRDIKATLQYQMIDRTIEQVKEAGKKPGVLTVADLVAMFAPMPKELKETNLRAFDMTADPTAPDGYRFSAQIDKNEDGAIDVTTELKPFWQADFDSSFPNLEKFGMTKDDEAWVADTQSYGDVGTVLSKYTKPVLLMNGEADIQTVVAGANEAYAKINAGAGSQVTLKTYPGLGHSFFPAAGFSQPLGPMEPGPLADLSEWLGANFGRS
jgi:uncharacterized protein